MKKVLAFREEREYNDKQSQRSFEGVSKDRQIKDSSSVIQKMALARQYENV